MYVENKDYILYLKNYVNLMVQNYEKQHASAGKDFARELPMCLTHSMWSLHIIRSI